jgi:peptidyl-dipeptidase Dcp
VVKDAAQLAGIPEAAKEAAAELAEKKGKPGQWLFNLDYPMVIPVMTYAKDRELRRQMFMANASKAFGGKYDNQAHVLQIAKLRFERAQLLGYATHAHYVLEERMASTPEKVQAFLDDLLTKARPMATREMEQLRALAVELDGVSQLERWDTAYYAEILKQREIGLDEEALRPYFELDRVVAGVLEVCRRLYDLHFTEVHDLPTYHADVRVFEVRDGRGGHVGLFYMDFFPRETKRGGAWMTNFSDQGHHGGEVRRPHVGIVCNFTKPTKSRPSLLSLDEVLTLYHEVGHALHGLLSQLEYTAVSGTSVYWDFVELPSQMMENWVYEKECLDLFARHYENGETIPADLVARVQRAANFMEGTATLRQIGLGNLDLSYHAVDPRRIHFVPPHEDRALAPTTLLPSVPGTSTSCAFSHIFAGGYSAGYYSYKWAEVLDADAFELFREKGIFNREVADLFREHILEKGGSEHPMELYKRFRGQEPTVDALLRRAGLSA